MSEEMKFVKNSEIPERTTKKGVEWLGIFNKIPVGQSWTPNTTIYKIQSIRSARKELEKKKLLKNNIVVTQRMVEGKLTVFVSNYGTTKPKN